MNGYEKMKMLRRMKITKIVSTVTALSMAVTGLAVAASANDASADAIGEALGGLTDYAIVAGKMDTSSHFEGNFAVNKVSLYNNFSVSNFVSNKSRTITFRVSTEVEDSTYYFGVYSDGELVNVTYRGESSGVIAVSFDEPGTKSFVVTVPEAYKYSALTVHQLIEDENNPGSLVICDDGVQIYSETASGQAQLAKNSECIIAEEMTVSGELFDSNKTVYVGSELYSRIDKENDGRWKLDGNIIANNSNTFVEKHDASETVNDLLDQLQAASDKLATINSDGDKAIYLEFHGSVNVGSSEAQEVLDAYKFIKDNPDYVMLVNVYLEKRDNVFAFNSGAIGDWDADASSRIVFNFIGGDVKDTLVILGDGFRGTALAANARVRNAATFCGAVYAPEFAVGNGELHMATYRAFNHVYSISFEKEPEESTTEETTTEETTTEETTTEETTTEETTTEETTPEETTTTPEETTTTTPEITTTTTEETTTTTPKVTTTTTEETTTTTPEITTTTPEETITTTPEITTTTTPETTTTTPEITTIPEVSTTPEVTTPQTTVATTTPEVTTTPVTTTTTVTTTTPPETTTTTTAPETTTTTTAPETTTTTTVPEETTTTTEEITTTTVPEETTAEETTTTTFDITSDVQTTTPPPVETTPPTTTTSPPTTTTPPEVVTEVTTTVPLLVFDEDIPLGDLIIIDEDIPLGDLPMATGVESNVGMFLIIGGAALSIGVGAQVYTVVLKKKK